MPNLSGRRSATEFWSSSRLSGSIKCTGLIGSSRGLSAPVHGMPCYLYLDLIIYVVAYEGTDSLT